MKVTILCPFHTTQEEIEIPDSYIGKDFQQGKEVIFEGDIPCKPTQEGKRNTRDLFVGIIHIKIHFKDSTYWIEKITKKEKSTIISL